MKKLSEFNHKIDFLLTDIDDTMTDEGYMVPEAFQGMWDLHKAGIKVIPVTGRPAGWCELIARQWPVAGVIGENGGFYFRYHDKKMKRYFVFDEKVRKENKTKLLAIEHEVLSQVPGTDLASDQFCRLMDLAIDFCEDVAALPKSEVQKIVSIFEKHGAQAKVSSIHVNGWFGDYNKVSTAQVFLQNEFHLSDEQIKLMCGFCGDSPNDEPMFRFLPNSFGVANIKNFLADIKHPPTFVSMSTGGHGFAEICQQILKTQKV